MKFAEAQAALRYTEKHVYSKEEDYEMALGYDGKLYILAFDHRGSFQKKMFGIEGDPTRSRPRRSATPSG